MNSKPDNTPDGEDQEILALYREISSEQPGPRHDAAVLAAAQAELRQPAKRHWLAGWKTPLALAVTVVLAATLTLTVEREQSRQDNMMAPAVSPPSPKPESRPAPDAGAAPTPAEAKEKSTVVPDSAVPAKSANAPAATAGAMRMQAPPTPAGRDSAAPQPTPSEERSPAATDKAPSPMPLSAPVAPSASGATRSEAQRARRDAAPSLDSRGNASAAVLQRSAQEWVVEIRALRNAGRETEARAALRQLQVAYPDFPLPEDLRTQP